nr:hypothetical protein [Streptomyces melanosporofaciens]
MDRSTVNAWHDDRSRTAIEATGRRKLIFAGVSLEVCAALPRSARRPPDTTHTSPRTLPAPSARPRARRGRCRHRHGKPLTTRPRTSRPRCPCSWLEAPRRKSSSLRRDSSGGRCRGPAHRPGGAGADR